MDDDTKAQLVSTNRTHASRMADEFLELHRLSNIIKMSEDPDVHINQLKEIDNRLQKVDFSYIQEMHKNLKAFRA